MNTANSKSAWRIERNHKMHFRVARDTSEGKEVRCSASGKESSFRTYAAASRVAQGLNEDAATEAELRAELASEPVRPALGFAGLGRLARGHK